MSNGEFSEDDIIVKVKKVTFADGVLERHIHDDSDDYYDSDISDTYYDSDDPTHRDKRDNVNAQGPSKKISSYQPNEKLFKKYLNKINVDKYEPAVSRNAEKFYEQNDKKIVNTKIRIKDKRDRATVEQVLDPRTRMILYKLLNRGTITEVYGCISTGKEAHVYHAPSKDGSEYAIKIYNTSVLTFKDRDKYVRGDARMKNYHRGNPHKMVRTWAEKEMRNLARMHNAELNVPKPIVLRSHVLVMEFLGENGIPSPKLKDVNISQSTACSLYRDCVILIWKMYNICKLVHADLSEYNILYHNKQLYIIDVSQSIEYTHGHPHSTEFLKRDFANINSFFRKKGVATLTVQELHEFVTDTTINENNLEDRLDNLSQIAASRNSSEMMAQQEVEEEVFKQIFIPKRLKEITNFDKGLDPEKKQFIDNLIQNNDGDNNDETKTDILQNDEEALNSVDSSDNSDEDDEEPKSKFISSARPKGESSSSKKERKKAVKEEKAEKRKTKTPKHVKKRREKSKK